MGGQQVQQTKLSSLIEALVNIVIGFTINYFVNLMVFPLFNMHISALNNFYMGLIYTLISVVRSYALRRWFNAHLHDAASSVAAWWVRVRT
jgi:hypothetical protein